MDIARLVLDYLQVLIWPTAVVVALWMFRKNIGGLIDRARSAEALGVKAGFDAAATIVASDDEIDHDDRDRLAADILRASSSVKGELARARRTDAYRGQQGRHAPVVEPRSSAPSPAAKEAC